MKWQDIKVASDNTHFTFDGKAIFDKIFIEVLKFHTPGLAPVKDESGSFHIDFEGKQLYSERYSRTFGYYCNRAAVIKNKEWFHITEKGERVKSVTYSWTGNFQENLCTVRDVENNYFHIDLSGIRVYEANYRYCGDFKDGIACVRLVDGKYKHITVSGSFLNDKTFLDLGVFHKNFATAKDIKGWHHIDRNGNEIYQARFLEIEPFYNGFALVTTFDNQKIILNEKGDNVISI